mgnify:CR=1 FL=1
MALAKNKSYTVYIGLVCFGCDLPENKKHASLHHHVSDGSHISVKLWLQQKMDEVKSNYSNRVTRDIKWRKVGLDHWKLSYIDCGVKNSKTPPYHVKEYYDFQIKKVVL